jgi:transcription elongation factor GreA
MSDITYLSREGFEKLTEELRNSIVNDRAEISRQIAEARDKGDLSENAEYDAAKDAQAMLEMKISKLETIIANARILDDPEIDTSKAYILSNVEIFNHNMGKKLTYMLVAPEEADHKLGKISIQSPIGKSIIGKSVGDILVIDVPAGQIKIEILNISR